MLTGVTITGADDGVDPRELFWASEQFPFVEWAILFSAKRTGTPRYPSREWVWRAADAGWPRVQLAAHFCGQMVRETLAGNAEHVGRLPSAFRRVQLNGYVSSASALPDVLAVAQRFPDVEFILQARSEEEIADAWMDARVITVGGGKASVLFDPSGGRGIEAFRWPPPFAPGEKVRLGYAGGIKPENVEEVVGEILMGGISHDFWIDMESGVRSSSGGSNSDMVRGNFEIRDCFDLGKVRQVLERTARFVKAGCRRGEGSTP